MINLSYSAAQKYLTSPFAYFAHYFLRLRTASTGSALVFGGALDEGLNSLLADKRDGKEPDLDKAKLAFDESFGKHKVASIKYSKADLDASLLGCSDINCVYRDNKVGTNGRCNCKEEMQGVDPAWVALSRKGHILIEEYNKQIMPKLEKVLLVQHKIDMKNEDGDAFTGIIDLVAQIDGKVYVIDNKSTTKPYTANSANESSQLATYFEAIREEYNPHGVAYITVPKTIRKVKKPVVDISIIYGQAGEQLIDKTFSEYDGVLQGIRKGRFPCTPEVCCSSPWGCDYRRYCESGGKDMTGLVVSERK